MPQGLQVSRLVNVDVIVTPVAAQFANFDSLLLMGDSDVINVRDRIRSYNDITSVADDFGTSAPEYLAAVIFFSQTPTPSQLYIGRWARTATHGMNIGGPLTLAEQAISNWSGITNGSFTVVIDGATHHVGSLNFTGATNLNGVASVINAAVPDTAISAAVAAPGSGYAIGDTITAAGGTHSAAAVATVTHVQVVSATVAATGTGGVNGPAVVTGTTGTGTKFTANVVISGGGITAVQSIATGGDYTVAPTAPTAEPVTGASLSGAELDVALGVLDVSITTPGSYTALPANPVAQASTSGSGTGATLNVTWSGSGGLACVWNGEQFIFSSASAGSASTVSALTAGTSGTDISAQLKATASLLEQLVPGADAETALEAVIALDNIHTQWYGLMFASPYIVDADHLAIAAYIEADGQNTPHLYGLTTAEATALSPSDNSSIGYQLKQLGYRRTFYQYSSSSPYACAAIFGRGVTVDFNESLSVITFMWKQEVGVVGELLKATEADALDTNNYNYYADFQNGTTIVVNGKVADGDFIDNTWNLDWFANRIQTDVFNLLYTTPTKIPQTNAGEHLIKTTIEASCKAAVFNGILGPGQWNSAGFGQLQQGDFLDKGFYVYQPPLELQAQSDREARKSVPFQVAAKLAGAVHTVSITVTANR